MVERVVRFLGLLSVSVCLIAADQAGAQTTSGPSRPRSSSATRRPAAPSRSPRASSSTGMVRRDLARPYAGAAVATRRPTPPPLLSSPRPKAPSSAPSSSRSGPSKPKDETTELFGRAAPVSPSNSTLAGTSGPSSREDKVNKEAAEFFERGPLAASAKAKTTTTTAAAAARPYEDREAREFFADRGLIQPNPAVTARTKAQPQLTNPLAGLHANAGVPTSRTRRRGGGSGYGAPNPRGMMFNSLFGGMGGSGVQNPALNQLRSALMGGQSSSSASGTYGGARP